MRASTSAAVLLRVVTGIAVGSHGLRKILGGAHTMIGEAVAKMGFPAPEVMAWLIAVGETTGFLLALGLLTRFAGLVVAVTMAGVAFFANGHLWSSLGKGAAVPFEYSVLLAVLGLYFAITGPFGASVDGVLNRRTGKSA